MRDIVTPGDMVSESAIRAPNTYISQGRTYSKVLGIKDDKGIVIPLEGVWTPRIDDSVIGIVSEVKAKVYIIDLAYFGRALLIPGKYDNYEFTEGDVINAIIKNVEGKNTIILNEPQQLRGGTILSIKPKKIPRVIGKKSTMIRQIAEATGSHIIVGMNGLIWLNGGNIVLATEALIKIEREAHISGLTDTIKNFLDEKK
jgi:exosome complex component RRP4